MAGTEIPELARQRRVFGTNRTVNRLSTFPLHMMLLPGVVILFIFNYVPMAGVVIAFQEFNIYMGLEAFWKSEWVGFENYRRLITMGQFTRVFRNTVWIAFLRIVVGLTVPITISILLNELRRSWLKRSVQTLVYIPHFVSWVVLGGIVKQLMMTDGLVNQIVQVLGNDPIPFLQSNRWFVPTLIITNTWKEFGFRTIVYLAAISGIAPTLYEAAIADGATRIQQTRFITLPGMKMIIILTAVLALQNVLNAGFDQIFNLYNVQVYETGDILDTYVFRITFESATPSYHIGTAIGLFKSVISLVFISTSYYLARKLANYQIF